MNKTKISSKELSDLLHAINCSKISVDEVLEHKIRKTYISTLIDATDININYIREQVGHADERTTYGNYCFNRRSKSLTAQSMEKALVKGQNHS